MCVGLIVSITLTAQDTREVKIKLNNGHRITGQLVSYSINESITIRLGHDQELTFPMEEVAELKMEDFKTEKPYTFKDKRFYNRTSISALTGESSTGFSVNHTITYQFHRKLGVGLGFGVDNYYKEDGYDIFPVFMEIRSYLMQENRTPFIAMRGGYAFAFTDEEIGQIEADGGWMINPTIGYRLSAEKFMVDIFAGIKIQKSDYEYRDFETRIRDDITFRRLDIGLGFMF